MPVRSCSPRRLREELRGVDARYLHVQGAPRCAQGADPPGRRAAVRGQGRARQRDQGSGEAEAARCLQGHAAGLEKGRRAAARRRRHRDLPGGSALMPVRRFKPTSPGRRFMTVSDFAEVTKSKPEKALTETLTRKGGRNNNGRITTRHQGGGHKRRFRVIDFKRRKDGIPAKVAAIEYDPNRSARIALLHYADGFKSYILAPAGLRVG